MPQEIVWKWRAARWYGWANLVKHNNDLVKQNNPLEVQVDKKKRIGNFTKSTIVFIIVLGSGFFFIIPNWGNAIIL